MSDSSQSRSSQRRHGLLDIVALLLAAGALHIALGNNSPILNGGGLLDTDAYMRLIRVEELWRNGDWYQTITAKLGAPDGLSLHWTRPLDIMILIPAWVLTWFGIDMHRAILWAGVAIAPALHTLACFAVAWAAKPILPQHGAWRLAALMLLINGSALSYSLAGRPDHHPLCLLLIAVGAGYTIRACLDPTNRRAAIMAGICAGAGIWVAPETLLTIAPALAAFGLFWLLRAEGGAWATAGYRFGIGMAVTVFIAILIEQPPANWLVAEYDKVSVLYLALACAILIDFRLAAAIAVSGWPRWALGLAIALGSFLLLAFFFPRFYLGSLGNIEAADAAIFIDEVSEMKPLWPTNFELAMQFFRTIGNTLAAVPAAAWFLWHTRRSPHFAAFAYLTIAYVLSFAAAMLHLRLALATAAFGAILGCGLFAILCDLTAARGRYVRLATRLAGYFIVAIGLQIIGMLHLSSGAFATGRKCDPVPVADWLNENMPVAADDALAPIILTDSINSPPAIAYLTNYRLVGGPYHRGNRDVADMFAAVVATDDAASRAVLDRRQVDLLLICTQFAPRAVRESPADSLYHRLARDAAPDWLTRIPMSAEIERSFRLYAVKR